MKALNNLSPTPSLTSVHCNEDDALDNEVACDELGSTGRRAAGDGELQGHHRDDSVPEWLIKLYWLFLISFRWKSLMEPRQTAFLLRLRY